MGQLFNRLRRFAATQFANTPSSDGVLQNVFNDADEELRKIIDELSNKATNTSKEWAIPPQQQQRVPREVLAAHTVLNVRVGASVLEIKQAYRKAITSWHPDKFVQADAATQQQAQTRARNINAAYVVLEKYYKFG